jgi:hypothetical protein
MTATNLAARRPLRILHVGSFPTRIKGAFIHGAAPKISNGLIRNGHYVLNFSDRDHARAASVVGFRQLGVAQTNRALVRLCREVAPDLFLLGHADLIAPETIVEIRSLLPRARMVQWNNDGMFDAGNVARLQARVGLFDITFVAAAGPETAPLLGRGAPVAYLPNPVDPSVERGRAFLRDDLGSDLLCPVGKGTEVRYHCGHARTPEDLARLIQREIPDLRCTFPGMFGQPYVLGDKYQLLLEDARMGLNLSKHNDHYLYSSDRLAHMMGNGVLAFVDRATGLDRFFSDDEVAFYATEDELIAKLEAFHADDARRREVAARGWRKYHAEFNERRIAAYMLDAALGELQPGHYPWPTVLPEPTRVPACSR